MKVSVSYITSKYKKKETIKLIDRSNCDYIHVDLMDGVYVNNKNFTISEVINDLSNTSKLLDVHLMVNNPDKYISKLGTLNINDIIFHPSTSKNIRKTIELIKSMGFLVGLAINPDEDIHIIDEYLSDIDIVLIMSVVPGLGGQEFIPSVIDKIDYLSNYDLIISIDGGINEESINYLIDKKIDILVSGSYICMSDNYNSNINKLLKFNKK